MTMKSAFDNSRPRQLLGRNDGRDSRASRSCRPLAPRAQPNLLAAAEVCLNVLDFRQVTSQDWQNL